MSEKRIERFYDLWKQSGLLYAGKLLEVSHRPFVICSREARHYADIVSRLQELAIHVTRRFIGGSYRDFFSFDSRLMELILADPGYDDVIPFCRWDSYPVPGDRAAGTDGGIKFLELNTDGTSGMAYVEALEKIYLEVFNPPDLRACRMKQQILDTLLKCYRGFKGRRDEVPQIAIVDWEDVATRPEQIELCRYFSSQGVHTIVADPRRLTFDGAALWCDKYRIDLIYRRVVTREYLDCWDDVLAMTQAYVSGIVCVAGSFRSQIAFDKRLFALMSMMADEQRFDAQENRVILAHLPWTRLLDCCDPEFLMNRQDELLLKPHDLNRGRGIVSGRDVTSEGWKQALNTSMNSQYIVQERVKPVCLNPSGAVAHLGHYVFGGCPSGWMVRVAGDLVLTDESSEVLAPCLLRLTDETESQQQQDDADRACRKYREVATQKMDSPGSVHQAKSKNHENTCPGDGKNGARPGFVESSPGKML